MSGWEHTCDVCNERRDDTKKMEGKIVCKQCRGGIRSKRPSYRSNVTKTALKEHIPELPPVNTGNFCAVRDNDIWVPPADRTGDRTFVQNDYVDERVEIEARHDPDARKASLRTSLPTLVPPTELEIIVEREAANLRPAQLRMMRNLIEHDGYCIERPTWMDKSAVGRTRRILDSLIRRELAYLEEGLIRLTEAGQHCYLVSRKDDE